MARERLARRPRGLAGKHALLPIAREPIHDELFVDPDRRVAAEHPVDLQRLVKKIGTIDIVLDLLFQPEDQPWPQQPLQPLLIGLDRYLLHARAFAETERMVERR